MSATHLRSLIKASLFSPAWLLLQTQQLWAQRLGQGGNTGGVGLWRVAAALVVCIAVAVAAAYILRIRLQGGVGLRLKLHARRLQLVETLRVGTQTDICIVSFDGEEMLIASSSRNVRLLRLVTQNRDTSAL